MYVGRELGREEKEGGREGEKEEGREEGGRRANLLSIMYHLISTSQLLVKLLDFLQANAQHRTLSLSGHLHPPTTLHTTTRASGRHTQQ